MPSNTKRFRVSSIIRTALAAVAASGTLLSTAPAAGTSPSANLAPAGRGERLAPEATTDVWALGNYAYTGTFVDPCGGDPAAGVWIWDVHNHNNVEFVGIIPSPSGSFAADVKAATMNSGDILVHSNQSCLGGPGGFEIYDVNEPTSPIHLASVGPINELNPVSDALFGGLTDLGVSNLFLFTADSRDYVSAVVNSAFDNFRIYDITDPANPVRVAAWGAEEIFDPGVGDETADVGRVLNAALWLLDGFGASQNRFLNDATISADGTRAYLANWDAGLVLLDISDPTSPQLVSVALDPVSGSPDGEVNSTHAWPSEDGSIVVETEFDTSAWEAALPPGNLTFADQTTNTIPGTAISTLDGDTLEASPTGNFGTATGSSVSITSGPLAGQTFDAIELSGSQPRFSDTGPIDSDLVWVGRACIGDPLENPLSTGDIAVVRRGACTFAEKLATVAAQGAAAIVIANDVAGSTPWGGVRIWDYTDPANPVLASTFATNCSLSTAPGGDCAASGTYSAQNVYVETEGNKVEAYVSWHSDGTLILDVSDPYDPAETARHSDRSSEFEAQNGGSQDVWGIYKLQRSPWIYASDHNGGLYVLKEYGGGSGK